MQQHQQGGRFYERFIYLSCIAERVPPTLLAHHRFSPKTNRGAGFPFTSSTCRSAEAIGERLRSRRSLAELVPFPPSHQPHYCPLLPPDPTTPLSHRQPSVPLRARPVPPRPLPSLSPASSRTARPTPNPRTHTRNRACREWLLHHVSVSRAGSFRDERDSGEGSMR